MFRIDGPGAVGELPVAREGVNAPGFFGPGNPATGQMSTRVTYEWLNAVQEELVSVITEAGIDLSKENNAQLLAALGKLTVGPEAVFTPPTENKPGKAGLVPGPGATPDGELLLRFLSARGWGKLAPQFFDRVWTPEGADTLTLGIITVPTNTNIDTLTTPGRYYCSQFQSIFGSYPGMVEVYYLKGSTSDGQRSALQIYHCDAGFVAARGSSNLFPPNGKPNFTATWTMWSAVRPSPINDIGKWRSLGNAVGSGNSVTLPPGGAWAFFISGIQVGTANVQGSYANVAAGGTVISVPYTDVSHVWGFCWRIA